MKAEKIPLALPQNEHMFPKSPPNQVSRACHALRKSQDLQDVGASVILALKIVLFFPNMILKHKPTNSTQETKLCPKVGGKAGVVEITEKRYITTSFPRLILLCLDFETIATEQDLSPLYTWSVWQLSVATSTCCWEGTSYLSKMLHYTQSCGRGWHKNYYLNNISLTLFQNFYLGL